MLPVKDDIPTDRVPVITLALLLANALVFVLLHTGLAPLLVNLLFLWLFAPNVEDALGRVRFLAFYLAGGLVAAGAQIAVDPGATLAPVGAAGATAAVLGAYLRLYPWAHVLTVVFCILFFTVVEIPVLAMVVLWFALQVVLGVLDLGDAAYAAHLAGFAFGLLTVRLVATHVKTPESLLRRGRAAWQ